MNTCAIIVSWRGGKDPKEFPNKNAVASAQRIRVRDRETAVTGGHHPCAAP